MFYTNYERLCNEVGLAPSVVAAKVGVTSTGTVPAWKKGSVPRPKIVSRLVKFFNENGVKCEVADLFAESDDEDEKEVPQLTALQAKYSALDSHGRSIVDFVLDEEYARCTTQPEKVVYIRHYFQSPAAGPDGLANGEDYEDIPYPAYAPRGADYCLTVSGDSMEPYIRDGQMVFVKRDVPLQDFDVGIFCVDGGIYCKQIAPSYDGSLYLLSANPKRESANIIVPKDANNSVTYFGKVLLPRRLPQPYYE